MYKVITEVTTRCNYRTMIGITKVYIIIILDN